VITPSRMGDLQRLNGLTNLLGERENLFGRAGREERSELLASEATEVIPTKIGCAPHGAPQCGEALISFLMSVSVIVELEEIDIDQDHPEGLARLRTIEPKFLQNTINRTAIGQAGQDVGCRQSEQFFPALQRFLLPYFGPTSVQVYAIALTIVLKIKERRQ
jgi:hypothetical protein